MYLPFSHEPALLLKLLIPDTPAVLVSKDQIFSSFYLSVRRGVEWDFQMHQRLFGT